MFFKSAIIIFLLIKLNKSANILAVYPTPAVSHQAVFQTITEDLLEKGHNLTVLTPNPLKIKNPNLTEIDWSSSYTIFQTRFNYEHVKNYRTNMFKFLRTFFDILAEIMKEQLSDPNVKKLIKEKDDYKFDVMILEHIGYFPYLGFGEIFNIPIIGITSFESANTFYGFFGSGANIFANVELNFPYLASELTFMQRWECMKFSIFTTAAFLSPPYHFLKYDKLLNEHFPGVEKRFSELMDRVELLMVNAHPAVGFVRPLVPNTVQLGFLHIKPPKALEEGPLKKFLDESQNGVIYVSLGTNIKFKDLDTDLSDVFINVFKDLKYDVLWKYENENLPNKPKNVMIQKWFPQADLLAHPKIKLFITQCGQQSSDEAIDRTVPMIFIPFVADQPGLAVKLQKKGVGRYIDYTKLDEKILREAIDEVLKPQYKENVIKLRELVYDQPMSSREKAIWWIEYFIRHKGVKHQAYPGRLVPFYKKYCLDFIAIGVIMLHLLIKALKLTFKCIKRKPKTKTE